MTSNRHVELQGGVCSSRVLQNNLDSGLQYVQWSGEFILYIWLLLGTCSGTRSKQWWQTVCRILGESSAVDWWLKEDECNHGVSTDNYIAILAVVVVLVYVVWYRYCYHILGGLEESVP